MANPLTIEAQFTIEAVQSEGVETKLLKINAYTGTPLRVPKYDLPIIVDIEGAFFVGPVTPILKDHQDSIRLGITTQQTIEKGRITATAKPLSTSDEATRIMADAKEGFPFQASIGATPTQIPELIRAGERVNVNGKTYEGPCYVSRKTAIKEITICTFGADPNTSVIAAKEISDMTFEDWLKSIKIEASAQPAETIEALRSQFTEVNRLKGTTVIDPNRGANPPPVVPAPLDIRAQAAADLLHVQTINGIFAKYKDVDTVKIGEKEITATAYQMEVISAPSINAAEVELNLFRSRRAGPAIHVVREVAPDLEATAYEINVLRQMNDVSKTKTKNEKTGREYGIEAWYTEQQLTTSDRPEFKYPSLHSIQGRMIEAAGLHHHGGTKTKSFYNTSIEAFQRIKASGQFSTLLVTNIFENVANKIMLAAYDAAESTWEGFCQVRSVSDFKPVSFYRLMGGNGYQKVGIEGELKHGVFDDAKHTFQIETWGMMMGLSRQHMINDDMGAFEQLPREMAINAALALEQEFFRILLEGDLYDGTNTITDPLSMDALDTARLTARNQVDKVGRPIALTPDRILTGTGLATIASNIYRNTVYTPLPGSATPTALTNVFPVNPVAGLYRPYDSQWINNTAIRDQDGKAIPGQSNTKWFLFVPPERLAAYYVGFLNGERAPKLDSSETTFNIPGGMMFRSYRDFGFGLGDKRASVMSTGEGGST